MSAQSRPLPANALTAGRAPRAAKKRARPALQEPSPAPARAGVKELLLARHEAIQAMNQRIRVRRYQALERARLDAELDREELAQQRRERRTLTRQQDEGYGPASRLRLYSEDE